MANNTTYSYTVQFRHQSQNIPFSNWIPLLTICFAPLFARLIAGAPKTVYLHNTIPPWHEIIVHYNPTSIMWRYYAILDRRARARSWTNIDMAAGNALFWTSHGWDGSEAMVDKCRDFCVRQPPSLLRRLLSKDALKTVIVTLQGIQAVYLIVDLNSGFIGFALDTIFMPLAFIGLLRLPSALWLTDEFLFLDQHDVPTSSLSEIQSSVPAIHNSDDASRSSHPSDKSLLQLSTVLRMRTMSYDTTQQQQSASFRRITSPYRLLVRAFYAAFLLGCLALTVDRMAPRREQGEVISPATPFLCGWSYAVLLFFSAVIIFTYWYRDRSAAPSTVIPCASKVWYKAYTGFLVALYVVLVVVAALETRRSSCGVYSAFNSSQDVYFCPDLLVTKNTVPAASS